MINDIMAFNKKFVQEKGYVPYVTSKYPGKKIAILSCMDTRLTALLPAALGLKNGDVKMIKNAGGSISHPFGSVMRSLIIAIYDLNVEEVMVIGHNDCGMQNLDCNKLLSKMESRGVTQEQLDLMRYCGVDFEKWLHGFESPEQSVKETVNQIKNHPLIPKDVVIEGYLIDSTTGELTVID